MTPYVVVQLLHRRKQLEDDLAAMGADPKIVRAVTRPKPSRRGGSWLQHVLGQLTLIDKIDQLLTPHGIKLPKPPDWWTAE